MTSVLLKQLCIKYHGQTTLVSLKGNIRCLGTKGSQFCCATARNKRQISYHGSLRSSTLRPDHYNRPFHNHSHRFLPSSHDFCRQIHHQAQSLSTLHRRPNASSQPVLASLRAHSAYTPQYGIDYTKSRLFHTSVTRYAYDKEESKLEKTVKALKDEVKEKEASKTPGVAKVKSPEVTPVKKSLGQRVMVEIKHYYHGFRLLFIDIRVCFRLLRHVLNGRTLSRRERRQLVRTTADLFRLVPFLVFIVVPFMEFLLPVAVKLFPNMLPSTFKEEPKEQEKFRKRLKMKLEMAKFLQDTIEESAVQRKMNSDRAAEFAQFMEKVRVSGQFTTNEEILKFSKFFEDELTLENLSRGQLMALCRMLELNTIGTNNFLLFQLRMTLRKLKTDDKMIRKEGIDTLTIMELQEACRTRGMRALGMSHTRLRNQLSQWLELHLDKKIPSSLLLLTRTLYLAEHLSTEDQLKATISSLPETTAEKLKLNIQEVSGDKVDNRAKLELIKQEEAAIKADKKEIEEQEELEQKIEVAKKEAVAKREAEELVKETAVKVELEAPDVAPVQQASPAEEMLDTAPVLEDKAETITEKIDEVTNEDLKEIEEVLDQLAEEKQFAIEKQELEELKEEVSEYQEDLEELEQVIMASGGGSSDVKESKSSKRLRRKVNSMIDQLAGQIDTLEKEEEALIEDMEASRTADVSGDEDNAAARKEQGDTLHQELLKQISVKKKKMVTINELIDAMKKFKKIPDTKLQKIADVLDEDHDGNIDISHAMKVIELLGKENVKIDSEKMSEIVELLKQEADLEEEEKSLEKQGKETQKQEDVKEAQKA